MPKLTFDLDNVELLVDTVNKRVSIEIDGDTEICVSDYGLPGIIGPDINIRLDEVMRPIITQALDEVVRPGTQATDRSSSP